MANAGTEFEDDARLVRVRYSTVINYVSQLYRLFVAVGFTIIVTRKLSIAEYGLFTTIISLAAMLVIIYDIWGYWTQRFYARGRKKIASTAILLNMVYMPIAVLIFFLIGVYYDKILGWGLVFFILFMPRLVIAGFNRYFNSISLSSRPYILGKVNIIYETARIVLVYLLITILHLRLTGALASIVIASIVATASHYVLLKRAGLEIPKPRVTREGLSILLSNFYIPLVVILYPFLAQAERPILTAITASTIATAYLGVSYIPRSVILQSSMAFTSGLYARLLRSPSKQDIEDVLRICFIINIGVSFTLVSLSISILSLFKPEYISARILFIMYIFIALLESISSIFYIVAISLERKDLYEKGIKLMGTPLFKLPLMRFLRGIVSIISGSLAIFILSNIGIKDVILITLPYPIAWLITSIPYTLYMYRQAISKLHFNIPWREVFSSIIAGLAMLFIIHLLRLDTIIVHLFWTDMPLLAFASMVSIALYFLVVYTLSPWVREFTRKSLGYILAILRR